MGCQCVLYAENEGEQWYGFRSDFALCRYLNFLYEKSNSCRPTCVPFQQSQK